MDNQPYFGPQLSGGSHNISGINYQMFSALICLFDQLNKNEEILSMSLESINDFAIHQPHRTITTQVKRSTLNIKDIKQILETTYSDERNTIMIVASNFHDKLQQLLVKRKRFINAMSGNMDEDLKDFIKQDFHNELIKHGMENLKDTFLSSQYYVISRDWLDGALIAVFSEWAQKKGLLVDTIKFINALKIKVLSLSELRGSLNLEDIMQLVKEYSTEHLATEIIKKAYESQFINVSKILGILGETKEDILKPLENQIINAHNLFNSGRYEEALNIYLSLANFYPKEDIYLQCAVLYGLINKPSEAIQFCDKVLNITPYHYEAHLIKGTNLGKMEIYEEALIHLKEALICKESPEVHYNLGYIYWVTNKNIRAIEHYSKCLNLDKNFTHAHLNISICYFKEMAYELSLIHINRALELDPDLYQGYGHKGEIYRFFGLYDEAIKYFHECLIRDENNYQALIGIAFSFVENGYVSEAIIYFNLFLERYHSEFFNDNDSIGKKVEIIDIGCDRTLFATLELHKPNVINVHIKDLCLPISVDKSKDLVFIGGFQISNSNSADLSPIVGKIYENSEKYQTVLDHIRECVNLVQLADQSRYVDFENGVQVHVEEREKYIILDLIFNDKYCITGITHKTRGGFENFVEYFEKYGQCTIQLGCPSINEMFIIDGITEVSIKRLR